MWKLYCFYISVFIDEWEYNHSHFILSANIFGCFLSKMTELNSCDRDRLAYKDLSICCLSLYRKKQLPIPGLDHRGVFVGGLRRTYIYSWNFRPALFYMNLHGAPFCKKTQKTKLHIFFHATTFVLYGPVIHCWLLFMEISICTFIHSITLYGAAI